MGAGGADKTYEFTLQPRWGDMDAMNHVNNARYLDYAQEARVSFFLELMGAARAPLVVARQEVDYLRPMVYRNQSIVVRIEVVAVGNRSFTLVQTVQEPGAQGEVYAKVLAIMVAFDREQGGSRPLHEDERAALTASLSAG